MKTNVFLAFSLTAFLLLALIFSLTPSVSNAQYYDTQTGARINSSSSAANNIGGSGAPSCVSITSGISIGSRDSSSNGNVSRLQTYLILRGYLSSSATGYFGRQTEAAVKNLQIQNSLSAVGNVGPLTRARILSLSCGIVLPPTTPAPTLNYISPTSGIVGSQVYVSITNAGTNPQLFFDTGVITLTSASLSSGQYIFTVPSFIGPSCQPYMMCPALLRSVTPGSYPIKVTNTNGTSNTIYFNVTSGTVATTTTTQAPVISGIDTPTTLRVGELGSWTVHALASDTGSLYYSVLWGDETYVSTSGASAATAVQSYNPSASFTHVYNAPGVYTPTFSVRNANGQAVSTSASVNVTGASNATVYPVITSISPTSGQGTTTFTVTGTGFSSLSKVLIDGGVNSGLSVVSYTDTTLTFSIPTSLPSNCYDYSGNCAVIAIYPTPTYSTVGNHQISIANSNSRISNVAYISITAPSQQTYTPTVTSVSPTSGIIGSQVTIYGSNFTSSNNTVNFGSGAIPNISSNGSSVTFNVPSTLNPACYYSNPACGAPSYQVTPGTYAVSVVNANGTSNSLNYTVTSSGQQTYAPTITSVSPVSGLSGTVVTMTGSNFSATNNSINFAGVSNVATNVSSANGQTIQFTIPTMGAGTYQISVTTPTGTSNSVSFTVPQNVASVPVITTLSPISGLSGSQVTIYGSNFMSTNNTVSIGYNTISNLSSNGSSITFTVPSTLSTGNYLVSVTNVNGTSNSLNYTVNPNQQTTESSSMTLALGQTEQSSISIIVGGDMYYGLSITANSIAEDSRCPVNVTCAQAGRVITSTTLKVNSNYIYNVNLAVGDYYITPQGFKVLVTGVAPARTATMNSSDYRITYLVSK